jgi:hypothetical protein
MSEGDFERTAREMLAETVKEREATPSAGAPEPRGAVLAKSPSMITLVAGVVALAALLSLGGELFSPRTHPVAGQEAPTAADTTSPASLFEPGNCPDDSTPGRKHRIILGAQWQQEPINPGHCDITKYVDGMAQFTDGEQQWDFDPTTSAEGVVEYRKPINARSLTGGAVHMEYLLCDDGLGRELIKVANGVRR